MHKSKVLDLDLKKARGQWSDRRKNNKCRPKEGGKKNLKGEGGTKARSALQSLKTKIVGSTTKETEAGNNVGPIVS